MGADSFSQYVWNQPNLEKAVSIAHDAARDAHGHQQGYSGDIQTTDGVEIRSRTPMTVKEAEDFIYKDIDHSEKRGPAFAVRVQARLREHPRGYGAAGVIWIPSPSRFGADVAASRWYKDEEGAIRPRELTGAEQILKKVGKLPPPELPMLEGWLFYGTGAT